MKATQLFRQNNSYFESGSKRDVQHSQRVVASREVGGFSNHGLRIQKVTGERKRTRLSRISYLNLGSGGSTMASAPKLFFLPVVSCCLSGCFAPNVFEVSTKLSSQCGLALQAPNCVDPNDELVMNRLWERFVLENITSSQQESCVLAMECGAESGNEAAETGLSASEVLDVCVNGDVSSASNTQDPGCLWNCISAFLDCSPVDGQSCNADFVDSCLDTRALCEHRC